MGKVDHTECELSPISPESDPAKILEASLLEMDGILAGESLFVQFQMLISTAIHMSNKRCLLSYLSKAVHIIIVCLGYIV